MRASTSKHVVFVPGVLGSSLRYVGEGPLKRPIQSWVWSEELGTLLNTLTVGAARLRGPLEVGGIVREIRAFEQPLVPLYGPLLDHLEQLGFAPPTNATWFAYDWRLDNFVTAARLTALLRNLKDSGVTKVVLVCHSMGCLIARLSLKTADVELRAIISKFIQIAPPTRGAAKAFHVLNVSADLHPALSIYLRLKSFFDGDLQRRLLEAVRTFDSIYQLLPPSADLILATESGEQLTAFDERVWLAEYLPHLRQAQRVFSSSCEVGHPEMLTIYGVSGETDREYLLNEYYAFKEVIRTKTLGDMTVTIMSATWDTDSAQRLIIDQRGAPALHQTLPTHPHALEAIASALS
jgi:pimeloyl-ACP methyl ester carboxylesterase